MKILDQKTDFDRRLMQAGVNERSMTSAQRQTLAQQGFVVVPDLIDRRWQRQLQEAFEQLWQRNREDGARKKGTRHVVGWLEEFGTIAEPLAGHPVLLAAARQAIGRPFALNGIHGREPLPGHGAQGLHADWGYDGDPHQHHLLNSLWLLDDFCADNGPTRVVPGSHLLPRQRRLPGPEEKHPRQQVVLAPAGAVLIFNGHLLHGGTRHTGTAPRRAIQCGYVAAEFGHLTAQRQPVWLS